MVRRNRIDPETVWLLVKVGFWVDLLCLGVWKYTCHRAYSEYIGLNKNKSGVVTWIFNLTTPKNERPSE